MKRIAVFDELDHRMSVVKRWTIVVTIQEQSLAEHAFNVERIAVRIAQEWLNIRDHSALFHIMMGAHHHDDEEVLTGDIPSPAKKHVEKLLDTDSLPMLSYPMTSSTGKIVKLADRMEAYHFLRMEFMMGNQYIRKHLDDLRDQVLRYAELNFGPIVAGNAQKWVTQLEQTLSETWK